MPEIASSGCELTRFMTQAYLVCMKGLEWVMQHLLQYLEYGMVMQPDGHWDGAKILNLKVMEFPILEM